MKLPLRLSLIMTLMLLSFSSFGARSGFNDCYGVSQNLFQFKTEAVKVCAKAELGFSDCYQIAHKLLQFKIEAVKLCTGSAP